jgi:hypothetical protein
MSKRPENTGLIFPRQNYSKIPIPSRAPAAILRGISPS